MFGIPAVEDDGNLRSTVHQRGAGVAIDPDLSSGGRSHESLGQTVGLYIYRASLDTCICGLGSCFVIRFAVLLGLSLSLQQFLNNFGIVFGRGTLVGKMPVFTATIAKKKTIGSLAVEGLGCQDRDWVSCGQGSVAELYLGLTDMTDTCFRSLTTSFFKA